MSKVNKNNYTFGKLPNKMPIISNIDNYFSIYQGEDAISDEVYNDLNIEELYLFSNRCVTPVGEMLLYHKFRHLHRNNDNEIQEEIIERISSTENFRMQLETILSTLHKKIDYSVSDLLNISIELSKWHKYIKILPIVYCVVLLSLWFLGQATAVLIGATIILTINSIVHFWNKQYVNIFIRPLHQLSMIKRAANKISNDIDSYFDTTQINKSIDVISTQEKKIALFGLNRFIESDFAIIFTSVFELIKIVFLVEPILINSIADKAKEIQSHSKRLIDYIGEWDTIFSNASLRCWLADNGLMYSKPISIDNSQCSFKAENIYNPLVSNCVSNNIAIDNTTIITGSNMSGKSTFMRTIGANIISSYALNICYATYMELANYKLHTVLSVSDNINESTSYFKSEVERVKLAIDSCMNLNSSCVNIVLIDEIFKGTNTIERISISNAVIQHFAEMENTILIVSTHDIELAKSFEHMLKIFHFDEQVELDNQQIHFDYKLKYGIEYRRNAISMLKYCGYPSKIVACAENNRSSIEIKLTL